jgi:hypothetical protein
MLVLALDDRHLQQELARILPGSTSGLETTQGRK